MCINFIQKQRLQAEGEVTVKNFTLRKKNSSAHVLAFAGDPSISSHPSPKKLCQRRKFLNIIVCCSLNNNCLCNLILMDACREICLVNDRSSLQVKWHPRPELLLENPTRIGSWLKNVNLTHQSSSITKLCFQLLDSQLLLFLYLLFKPTHFSGMSHVILNKNWASNTKINELLNSPNAFLPDFTPPQSQVWGPVTE